jgi:uncharacterized protein
VVPNRLGAGRALTAAVARIVRTQFRNIAPRSTTSGLFGIASAKVMKVITMPIHSDARSATTAKCLLVVVKVANRCNLNCDYCYMFNAGDISFKRRPPVMPLTIVDAMITRIAAHCRRHKLSRFVFVLHGGEPLLAPMSFYRHFVQTAKSELKDVAVEFRLQTNGIRLTDEWCMLFRELEIGVGISLDGPRAANDRHRVDHKGRGSFDRTMAGWKRAVRHGLRPGLLIVIDIETDPLEVFDLVKKMNPPAVDFLLPDATYDKPPRRGANASVQSPHGQWLIKIFDAWTREDNPAIKIRVFNHVMRSILGRADGFDGIGSGLNEVLVIESDGEIQAVDSLRVCKNEITSSPYNVTDNELDDAFQDKLIQLYYSAHSSSLCSTCQNCSIHRICGGGFLPHRFSSKNDFDNPSIYCNDLKTMIRHVGDWFVAELPPDTETIYSPESIMKARAM